MFAYQVYFYVRYLEAIHRQARRKRKHPNPQVKDEDLPTVSVLVCAHNEAQNIEPYLQALLSQDYPTFEVIVVNDGSEDQTADIVEDYMLHDKRLHLTFVPKGARVGSTKKLGLTLAAKAARYDYLLLTDADCRPESNQWIREMVKGLSKEREIVIGYGGYFMEHSILSRMISYDTLFNGLHYLGAAIIGHPYMGIGRNLLYSKKLFFSSGGFSSQMTSRSGDDDLFINRVATKKNTAVVCTPESITWSLGKRTFHEWIMQKRRHLSVSPQYRLGTKLHLGIEPMTRGLFYALLIAIGCLSPLVCLLAALALWLIRFNMQFVVLNRGAHRLGQGWVTPTMMLWDIFLPIITLLLMCFNRVNKNNHW